MVGFSFSYQTLTQLKKFLWWRYFISKAHSVLLQLHQFPNRYLCRPSCFKNSVSQSGKKIPGQHYSKFSEQDFKSWSTKYLKLIIKKESWHIHNFFESVKNNTSLSSPFNAAVIGYFDFLIFCLITALAFLKGNVSSMRISMLHTCVLFIFLFCVKPKKWSLWQNYYWKSTSHQNESTHWFVTVCSIKCLPLKIGAYIFLLF